MELRNIAIAVNDIGAAMSRYEQAFGWTVERGVETQPAMQIETALLCAGDTVIELMAPLPGEVTLRRFLETRGEGLYRLAFDTQAFDATLARFEQNEVRYVPIPAAAEESIGSRIVFTHPKSAHGLMVELIEAKG